MPSHSPHASRPSTFRAPGWGESALPSSCCCWRSATSWGSAPFSHRSSSRIFIMQPGCIPSPMVIQDDDHQFGGGEASRVAASAPPSASRIFIILAGAEGELSRGSTSHMGRQAASSFSIQRRGRSPSLRRGRTLTTWGRPTASVVSSSVPGSLAQLALSRPSTLPPAA
jgi:hypothetical protein